jgi:hypothetical protein
MMTSTERPTATIFLASHAASRRAQPGASDPPRSRSTVRRPTGSAVPSKLADLGGPLGIGPKEDGQQRVTPHRPEGVQTLPESALKFIGSDQGSRLPSPSVCRDSTFSRPSAEGASSMLQARGGTPWGVNGDSDPSRSARQQQMSRRSTGSPRAGSEGDGKLDVRRSARADERRSAATPAQWSTSRAGRSEQTAPNPGTSWRGALGDHGRPDERSDGGADGTGAPG